MTKFPAVSAHADEELQGSDAHARESYAHAGAVTPSVTPPPLVQSLLEEVYAGEQLVFVVGFDSAIMGVTTDEPHRVVYSVDRALALLEAREDYSRLEAVEWLTYNVLDVYVGKHDPIWVEAALPGTGREWQRATTQKREVP